MSAPISLLRAARAALVLAAALLWPVFAGAADASQQVMTVLHLLDYIGVDYPEFVQDGRVLDEAEYREQMEFATRTHTLISQMPEQAGRAELLSGAEVLKVSIERKIDGKDISRQTAQLSAALLKTYPVAIAPRAAPDVGSAKMLFETQCAGCHGVDARGDGALAPGMEPPPANFHDAVRQKQRSIFGLYNVITLGVAGTSMPGFAQLPEQQRWALAFYVGQVIYSGEQRAAGKLQWQQQGPDAEAVANLQSLTSITPAELIAQHGEKAENLLAFLRGEPSVVTATSDSPLAISRRLLAESRRAYETGDAAGAMQSALSAYLEGFELAEAGLSAVDGDLMRRIEKEMMSYRQLIEDQAPAQAVAEQESAVQGLLQEAEARLSGGSMTAAGSFVGSFVILAREGLEAILVLAAMFAFLRKAERPDTLRYVHIGWIAALVLGIATWFVATYMIDISGATREITEGYTALLAAAILLSVGLWMHNKSYSNRWQQYVATKMRGALSGSRLWGLTFLAFIAVYREVFETVLFYRALWVQGDHNAIVAGFVVAAVAIAAIAWAIFYYSVRLPIRQFFSWSSAFIVALAVIFTGKGTAALQEAGQLPVDPVSFVTVPMLGIYPSLQVLGLQLLVLLLVVSGFGWNHLTARQAAAK